MPSPRNKRALFRKRLGDQHAVEWIAVNIGHAVQLGDMRDANRDHFGFSACDLLLPPGDWITDRSSSSFLFHDQLPGRHDANFNFAGFDGSPRRRR
jgi:hypothetical protein